MFLCWIKLNGPSQICGFTALLSVNKRELQSSLLRAIMLSHLVTSLQEFCFRWLGVRDMKCNISCLSRICLMCIV